MYNLNICYYRNTDIFSINSLVACFVGPLYNEQHNMLRFSNFTLILAYRKTIHILIFSSVRQATANHV